MKRYFVILIALIFLFTSGIFLPIHVFAASPAYTQDNADSIISTNQYNEYQFHLTLKNLTKEELLDCGFSEEEIQQIHTFSYESALLERAALSYNELKSLGYTTEQIELLKEYDGAPLTADSPVLAATAVCSGIVKFNGFDSSTSKMKFTYEFSWSSAPLTSYTDVMAVSWKAVNPSALAISSTATFKYAVIYYYSTTTGSYVKLINPTPIAMSSFDGYYAEYDPIIVVPEEADGTTVAWAKWGAMTFHVVPDGNASINILKVCGAIGHQELVGSYSIGFSGGGEFGYSFSVTPTYAYNTVGKYNCNITYTGTVTQN